MISNRDRSSLASSWWTGPAWIGIIAGAGLFRLAYLGEPMRTDEATTFLFLQDRSLLEILSVYSPNNHLLHSFLVKLSTSIWGPGEWTVRLPAFLAGWALIPSLGYIGRRILGPNQGLLTAAMAGCTAWLTAYSTDARGYSLAVLLLMWAFYHTWRGVEENRRGGFFLAGILAGLAVASVLSQLYALAGLVLATALVRGRIKERAGRFLLISAGAAIGGVWYLPALLKGGLGPIISNEHTVAAGLLPAAKSAAFQIPEVFGYAWPLYGNGFAVLGLTLLAGLVILWRGLNRSFIFVVFLGVWSFAAEVLQGVRAPARTFMYLIPLIHFLWIGAIFRLWKRTDPSPTLAWAALLALVGCGGYLTSQGRIDGPGQGGLVQAQEVAAQLVDKYHLDKTDRVLADVPDEAPLAYYLTRAGLGQGLILRRGELAGDRIYIVETKTNSLARLALSWPEITGQPPKLISRKNGYRIWLLEPSRELDPARPTG